MRSALNFGAALLLAIPALAQDNCAHNNCYRGVLPNQSRAQRISDCSTNLRCTTTLTTVTSTTTFLVTPTTTTISVTATPSTSTLSTTTTPSTAVVTTTTSQSVAVVTSTVTPAAVTTTVTTTAAPTFAKRGGILDRRQQACPGFTLPSYANNCNGFAAYSSVCSCGGVTATTVTVATGTTTISTTSTLTQVTITAGTTLSGPVTTVTTTAPTPTSTVTVTISSATTTTVTTLATSTTTTTTVSTGSALPAPTSCGNSGFQYALYNDTQAAGTNDANNAFNPTVVKNKTPQTQGVTQYLLQSTQGQTFYPPFASDYVSNQPGVYFILDHRGYIYTPVTGTYQFTASQVDDIVYTWFDSTAYAGWSQFNSVSKVAFNNGRGQGTASLYLQAGRYYAVRVLFKQAIGDDTFSYSITAPNGQVLIGSTPTGTGSGYAVQYACGDSGSTGGAPYPAFGSET